MGQTTMGKTDQTNLLRSEGKPNMTTQNPKCRKINNHLPDRKRSRGQKDSAILKCLSTKQINSYTEEALRQSEERYRTLVEDSFNGIFIQEGSKIIFANQRLYKMLGYDQGELEELDHWAVYHPDYRELTRERAQARMRGEKVPSQYEVKLQCKDGSSFDGEINARKIMVDNKPGIQVWVRDITDRKQAEEALRSERDKFRGMLLAIHDGVDIVNSDYIIEFQNKILQELFGDKIGEKCYAAYMGLEEPCHFCSIQEAIKTGSAIRVELVGKNGRNYELNSSPFTDVDGNVKVIELVRDITERKRAEDALRESENKYRTILENIADGYYEVDLAGNLTFFNDSVSQLLGYTKEELMGMNDRQYTDRENAQRLYQAFNKVYRTGEPTKVFDWEIIRKDGSKRFIESSVTLIKDSKRQPTGFRGIVRDSTERKCAEEALYIEKKRFQTLSDHAPFGMLMINQDGDFEYINPKFKELFGYDPSDIPDGKTWFRKAYPDPTYRHQVIEAWIDDLKSSKPGEKRSRVFKAICKNGTEKIVNFISVQLEKSEQLVACEDITERKRAEENLKESEERYRTILEDIEDGYYEVNLHGDFTFFNDSLCRMLGYFRDEMLGMGNQQYTDEENRKKLFQAFNEVYRTGKSTKGFGWEVFKKGGTKLFGEVSISLIKDSNGQPIGFRGIARDITQRKLSEEALRTEKQRFQSLSENAPFGMVMIDKDGAFRYINPKFRELFGYDLTDIPDGKTWFRKAYPDPTYRHDVISAWVNDLKSFKAEVKISRTFKVTCKDGTEKIVDFIPVQLETGENLMACEDITERKKAEEALSESEERFRAMTVTAADAITVMDSQGCIAYWNPAAERMFGYTPQEAIGKELHLLLAPKRYHEAYKKGFHKFKTTGQGPAINNTLEFIALKKDGTKFPMEVSTSAFRLKGLWHAVGIIRDITERKRVDEALRKSEERFQELFNDAPVGYFEYDAEGRITDVNRTELDMMGYSREEMIDRPVWEFVVENVGVHGQVLEKLAGKMPPARGAERIYRRKDGTTFPALIEDRLLKNSEGKIIGMRTTIQDITPRKQVEEEMRYLEEQFRQSQKMEAIGQLAGGIAHDFNNLLTVIKGYSQLSLLDLRESDILWGNIQEIQKAAQRAADLTRQLLAFSRRQILDLKVLDLNTLLKDLNKMLRRIIGEDIELVTLLAEDLGRVRIDPGQFEQIILNLAVNARDAMVSGGKLTIETSNVKLDEEYARAHMSVKPGSYVQLSISDTGVGMSFDTKEKVFEPFFTTKEKGKGTGLGLSTVYGIVKQCEGNIWIYSEPGHGTTFKIYLPRVEEELDSALKTEETDLLPSGNETVLLVEDDPLVRELAHRLLTQQGYMVLQASNGEEGLHVAQKHAGEKIHLLLTDVVMPQMSGKELAEKLKLSRPDIEVLYTSGYTDNAIVHHGVLESGTHFLQKPFSPKTLSHKVREVLDQK
jgi:PAS domain S-box-containing protein